MYTLHWLIIFLFLITSLHKAIHYSLYFIPVWKLYYLIWPCSLQPIYFFRSFYAGNGMAQWSKISVNLCSISKKQKKKVLTDNFTQDAHTHLQAHACKGRQDIYSCLFPVLSGPSSFVSTCLCISDTVIHFAPSADWSGEHTCFPSTHQSGWRPISSEIPDRLQHLADLHL